MSYPGNPSLSTAVKDRVVSTFEQSLALYKQGRTEEVIQGCTLLLQMDPAFDPAKKLLEKARNPMLPIEVDSLLPKSADDAMQQARQAMASRDFERVIHLTTEILTNDLMNDDARILGDEARDKLEAAPFVLQFARKCDDHLAGGNVAAARADLEKARQLDPTHPDVVRIGRLVAAGATAPAAASGPSPFAFGSSPSSSFVVDTPSGGRNAAQAADFGFTFEEEKAAPATPAFTGFGFDSPATPAANTNDGFAGFSFDSPAAPAAPAAPPADAFSGFSFGEPAPAAPAESSGFGGGFSFDAPAAPAPSTFSFDAPAATPSFGFDAPAAPADPAAGFDFSGATFQTSADDQKKIDQYLADGDRAFNAGDNQQAIDLWSRIFLIDVTNEQASERIERAKAKRRELDQRIEPMLAAGVLAFERQDYDSARIKFAEVLRADGTNQTAQDYMDRITDAVDEAAGSPAFLAPPPEAPPLDLLDEELPAPLEPPLMPPDADEDLDLAAPAAKSKKKKAAAAPAGARKKPPVALIATILGALLLLGGGWYFWSHMGGEEVAPAETQVLISRAASLARTGKYDQAILILQDIKPDDPQHDRALEMIAEMQQKKAQAAQMIDGRPAAVFYQEQLTAARAAFDAHDYVLAKRTWEQAMRVQPLPADVKPNYDVASQQVAKLDSAKALFGERKFADALAGLQPLLDSDPQNQNIRRMIIDAHFNLGATALQEERTADAMKEFDEVLKVDASDELAKRSRELADRYHEQPKDLLYRIYVKYLPLRQAT